MEDATTRYHHAIRQDGDGIAYLTKRLPDRWQDSATSFRLGLVKDPLPGHEEYAGRLVIPYLTRAGVVGLRFRCIEHDDCKPIHKDKYRSTPGDPPRIYNAPDLARPEPFLVICEGEIDAITMHAAGFPAIALPGTSGWNPLYTRIIRGYDTVFVMVDNDDSGAGRKTATKIAKAIGSAARIIVLPEGHDVNSLVTNTEDGWEALAGILATT